ncbi:hypothetical protein 1 [Cryphonectria naterciae splipalmivirus 1]|uniref:Uncharacterized protein n=1 Tax=Cryphonectria naterciae splipalmivirus 1 TaxID=2841740 RepID=A0AAD1NV09_9VIRU|nr:hypothetical protein 1 [Cryphonectria naterciae splipalmivirus 1]
MSDVGASAGASRSGPGMAQLNPERIPALMSKYQKMLGKDLEEIQIKYTAAGAAVMVKGMGDYAPSPNAANAGFITLAEFRQKKQEAAKPSDEEALTAFKNKWEVRLATPFPERGPASGKDADIQAFLSGQRFEHRRAMLMSNKQFKSAYPNGFTQAA